MEKASEEIFIILSLSHVQSKFSPLSIIKDMKVMICVPTLIFVTALQCEFLDDALFMLNLNIN